VEVGQYVLFQQFGMQVGHAVDRVTAHTGEMRHAHVTLAAFVDERQARNARVVAEEAHACFVEKARVDLEDDLEMPGQQLAEQSERPAFQCSGSRVWLV